jgi:arylsulfatase A-like enzyme
MRASSYEQPKKHAATTIASRRFLPAILFLGVASLVLGGTLSRDEPAEQAKRGARPDLIVIVVDTLRADYLGVTGRATARTPNIDGLIRRGTFFANAITPMPRTTPAVASMMTGLWPKRHGCREVGETVESGTLLAEVLRASGYTTIAVSANQAAGPDQNLERGFVHFVSHNDIHRRYVGRLYDDLSDAPPTATGSAEATTREALALVEAAPADTPLFLWTLYFDPHLLYRPPSPWQEQVDAPRCWELYERYTKKTPHLAWEAMSDFGGVATRGLADCQKLYDAEIAYTDHEIGKLLAGLRRVGRLDNAVVVFTSDHGENFGEGGVFFEHGDNAHDAGLRVPLAIAGPGVAENQVLDASVSLVDVTPTLLTLLGIAPEQAPEMDGMDLADVVRGRGSPAGDLAERIVFAESANYMRNQFYGAVLTGRTFQRACINGPRYTFCDVVKDEQVPPQLYDHISDPGLTRDIADSHPDEVHALLEARRRWPPGSARERVASTARFKLVQYPRFEGGYTAALYDRTEDPRESRDVSAEHPQVTARLLAALEDWAGDIPRKPPQALDPAVEEAMRKLGYIE